MNHYTFVSRTNYFRVKDETAFRAWAAENCLFVVPGGAPHPRYFTLFLFVENGGRSLVNRDEFLTGLAAQLEVDSVAVVLETGADGRRHLVGRAVALNARDERVHVTLDAIYVLAAHVFGLPEPTRAQD